MKKIYFNEDNEHFYSKHPASDMTEEGVAGLVDTYAATGTIKGILFCTNMQRALFDSEVWERFKDIDEQRPYMQNLRLLSDRNVDHFAIWLRRCRELDIEGWLTMRMNDSHGLKEAHNNMTDSRLHKWPSEKWRKSIHLRRAPYRLERSWEGSYNYLLEEVREHHLALVRELFSRYDMFGFEMDWMRWGMMFPPGFEYEGSDLLTDFVAEVRRIADEAEKRLGHKIKLAHRVPGHPESCLNYGFDVVEWSKRGYVDMLTLSSFLGGNEFTPQIKIWRRLLSEDTVLNVYTSQAGASYPGNSILSDEILRGAAAVSWAHGADNLYLFNECYREPKETMELNELMTTISDEKQLQHSRQRFPVAYTQAIIAGESNRNVLPVRLIQKQIGYDMGRMEENLTFRVAAGKVSENMSYTLHLGFSFDTDPETMRDLPVRINTTLLEKGKWTILKKERVDPDQPFQTFTDFPRDTGSVYSCPVPPEILHTLFNAVEIMPPQVPGQVVWVDLDCIPKG